jgi:serine/threonine-protein kinase RsbW
VSANVVTLVMPAKSEYLILARLALAGIAREQPIEESVLADLKLAVTEACGNAVRHAYGDDPGVVRVRFVVEREQIEIEVADDGTVGRTRAQPAPPADNALVESGMGLAIIRAVVDELVIDDATDASGTVVTMRKSLSHASAEA